MISDQYKTVTPPRRATKDEAPAKKPAEKPQKVAPRPVDQRSGKPARGYKTK